MGSYRMAHPYIYKDTSTQFYNRFQKVFKVGKLYFFLKSIPNLIYTCMFLFSVLCGLFLFTIIHVDYKNIIGTNSVNTIEKG